MTQGDLFRDEAIEKVKANAKRRFVGAVLCVVKYLAYNNETLTTDDIWEYIYDGMTHDNRAMGAVMRKAQAEGWIEPTDRTVKSTRPVCHSRPIRVWRSKLI